MGAEKRQKVYKVIMLIAIVAIVTYVVTTILYYENSKKYTMTSDDNASLIEKIKTSADTISKLLEDKYIGELNEEDMLDGAIKGMVDGVGDVYTEYYTKSDLEDFTASTLGNYVGIGIYMQADKEEDAITIISPIQDSPAEKAGLLPGDKIIKVNGKDYKAKDLNEVSSIIKGEPGTEVELTILRDGKTFDIKVKRDNVHINYVDSEMLKDNIGYISISTFDENCAEDFTNAYNKLVEKGAKKLIVDLRDNGGGLVNEALDIAELFCEKDEITLITADKKGNKEITKAKQSATIKIPTILLTNGSSASASEILAAALKDNGKAEIVGEKTFGKGVIQELLYLSNGGALKVTSSEYYTPKEEKINKVGIEPNYKVEQKELQLNKALEILKSK